MKVSVIIPVYNVSSYISECLDSILAQSYQNLEIICVNDGSTDNSLDILKEYKEKDNRITIVDKSNGGLSDARNAGLDVATGDYIYFIDGDDFISEDYIEGLLDAVTANDSDVSINLNLNYFYGLDDSNNNINQKIIKEFDFKNNIVNPSACNKIFKKSTLDKYNLKFKFGLKYEDYELWNRLYIHLKDLPVSTNGIYNYRQLDSSIMGQLNNKNNLSYNDDFIKCVSYIYKYQSEYKSFSKINLSELKSHLFRQNKKYIFRYIKDVRNLLNSFDSKFINIQTKQTKKVIKSFTSILGCLNLILRAYKK